MEKENGTKGEWSVPGGEEENRRGWGVGEGAIEESQYFGNSHAEPPSRSVYAEVSQDVWGSLRLPSFPFLSHGASEGPFFLAHGPNENHLWG